MEWIGAFYDRTNWCRLGVTWKQTDQMSSHSDPSIKCKRGIDCVSERSCVSMPTSVTELTNALSPGQYEDLPTNLPTRDDLRFGEVDLVEPPVGQETKAPSFVSLWHRGRSVAKHSNSFVIHTRSCF